MSAASGASGSGGASNNNNSNGNGNGNNSDDLLSMIESNLELEELDYDIYRSAKQLWRPAGARGIFGGAVIAQSLSAASKTVPDGYFIHSLHSYFVLKGDETRPVVYHVERVRDGKSYITRTVQARQRNRVIFTVTCSFQRPETSTLTHQAQMPPHVPKPESLPSDEELLSSKNAAHFTISEELRRRLIHNMTIGPTESRMVPQQYLYPELHDKLKGLDSSRLSDLSSASSATTARAGNGNAKPSSPLGLGLDKVLPPYKRKQAYWAKAKGKIAGGVHMHAMCIAYFSDSWFLSTSLRVNGKSPRDVSMMASLDHSIYFHTPTKADDWLYFEMESPWTGSGRGFNIGRIFQRDGTLVAECIQEGLIRMQQDAPPKSKTKL
ncbi:acyl-CoA thioesterase [Savitreella phatthalungensis]